MEANLQSAWGQYYIVDQDDLQHFLADGGKEALVRLNKPKYFSLNGGIDVSRTPSDSDFVVVAVAYPYSDLASILVRNPKDGTFDEANVSPILTREIGYLGRPSGEWRAPSFNEIIA